MSDNFRRVGRGGAGNFLSKKDVEDAESASEDLEAQRTAGPADANTPSTAQAPQASGPVYARAGRGGAGNYHEPAAAQRQEAAEAERVKAAVAANQGKPRAGLTGRGGAGNWTDATAQRAGDEEQKKRKDLEAKILQDVQAGLVIPPRTYHQHDRESEK
ncbi:hypothetical protein P8C59_005006 [Phyllachora maydis]|uniref:Uncharacterized protein n=1 Tax=Phyllachora maydis TaxID=1825666 RepID=A0AAD9I4T5_9PEZI|nr:hypothetical protein P8C59_005006 [Phyllachora maydis]